MRHIGSLLKIMLLSLTMMVLIPTSTMSSECIGCLEDCSKVLVAPARVITTIVEQPKVQKPDETQVYAYVEADDVKSPVRCKVETEGNTDTITCGW
jgi:hypothetical protein